MPMKIIPLGTAGMAPTRTRNLASFLLDYNGLLFLFDVGEATQKQLLRKNIRRNRIKYILISHWHADHTSGLPGLLHTMNANHREEELIIIIPKNTKKHFISLAKTFGLNELNFKIKLIETPKRFSKVLEHENFFIFSAPMEHTTITNAYAFIEKDKWKISNNLLKNKNLLPGAWLKEIKRGKKVKIRNKIISPTDVAILKKGKKVAYVTDTRPNENIIKISRGADLLIIETMFLEKEKQRAIESKHLTTKEAAELAKRAGVKKMLITHFSQRYKRTTLLLKEVKKIFKNCEAAKELIEYKI